MVHAVMGVTVGITTNPTWFNEDAAEFLTGVEERLWGSLGGDKSVANAQILISANATSAGWGGTSDSYSVGYAAVRMLHGDMVGQGNAGMSDLFNAMEAGSSLSTAIGALSTYADLASYQTALMAELAPLI